ncbi:hypothetical protein FHT77_005862 [Rhizobium sp. BK181]|uniref:hypothetical protein n=1 Tax=Rhizobium sp. BK181 TaxID=2587072 RepID=UPI0016135CFA|nr:hypothetical protein [Rhizobium sp. BK181]MBB3319944.1 hypothetical protein [Rhizobium sp. BK181]
MKLDEMVQRTNRHVAILGAFNLEQPKVLRGSATEVLDRLKFSLKSERVLLRKNGNIGFYSYDVTSPAELMGRISAGMTVDQKKLDVLPDGDGVLARYLGDTDSGQEAAIGAALLATLLDAADDLRAYDHPAFGVQLTEGLYYAWDARGLPPEIVSASMLREILYHPTFNLALLDYLRANARRHEGGALHAALLEGARKALADRAPSVTGQDKERLAEAFATETAAYREWLLTPAAPKEPLAALQHFAVLEERSGHGAEYQAVRSTHPIPEHHSGSLREVYGLFRVAHDRVADLAQCEPLMAFVNQWYLESFSKDKAGAKLASAIFQAIYKDNDEARPSKIPQRVKREAAAGHAEALKALLDNPSSKPQDVMAREIAETALEAYLSARRPLAAFEREELIGLMRDELVALSMKLFPGRDAVDRSNRKLVEAFHKAERLVERCFDVQAGDQAVEKLRAAMGPVFATLGEEVSAVAGNEEGAKALAILDKVLSAAGEGAQPATVAEALVLALGPAEGAAKAVLINGFRNAEGGKIDEAGNALRDAYEQLLSTPAGLKVAGSLAAVDDPDLPAEDAREAKVIVEIGRLIFAEGDEIQVKPADAAEADEMGATAAASVGGGAADGGDGDGGDSVDAKDSEDGELPVVAATEGDAAAERPRRSPVPVSLPLTAEERHGLFQDAQTKLNEGSRGKAAGVRRWAEALVDARARVMWAKGEIGADRRVDDENDAVGKQLAAGSRFVTLGEFFLAAPSANSPIGKPDTSFNAMIALHLMRQTGREHGRGVRGLLKDWKQKDADPNDPAATPDPATTDIRKVPLWQICPAIFDTDGLDDKQIAKKFREVAQLQISSFISEVRTQTAKLSRLAGFYRDVEEVKALLRLLKAAGNCQVTVVNTIASDYAVADETGAYPTGGPLFNGRKNAIDDSPPGTVFVSAQAFPPGGVRNLDILTGPLGLADGASGEEPLRAMEGSSWLRTQPHPGVFGVPVLIGRGVQSATLPVVGFDVPGLPALVALVTGNGVEALGPFRETWGSHTRGGGMPFEIGSANTVLKALGKMLEAPAVHGPIITARVLTALAHQRQFGPLEKRGRTLANPRDFGPTAKAPLLVQAVDATLAALSPLAGHLDGKDLGTMVFMQSNNGWESRKNRPEASGDPKEWIAFAPPPAPGTSIAPNTIFTRL